MRPLSDKTIAAIYRAAKGKLSIIGVGGVASAEDAYAKIKAGANLVELYTGLVYHGMGLTRDIALGLDALLERDGFAHIAEAVGAGH
jgi:dihydroorotate dehydrogenase